MNAKKAALPASSKVQHRDSLGCSRSSLDEDGELAGDGVCFYRKRSRSTDLVRVATPAADRGFLVGISMSAGHSRKIIQGARATSHRFDPGSVYLRDFREDYRADLSGTFDFVLMEVSRASFDRACEERQGARIRELECVTAMHDGVLHNLALAMAAAIERPQQACALFVDQMGVAISTYLVDHYGSSLGSMGPQAGRLSRVQEARAKEMLRSRLDGAISIGEIAQACCLSRSYFIRAFKETTGRTPLQWLLAERLSLARGLLLDSDLSLTEVAISCGFADQSHFTRVFARSEGQPPGNWRRQMRSS